MPCLLLTSRRSCRARGGHGLPLAAASSSTHASRSVTTRDVTQRATDMQRQSLQSAAQVYADCVAPARARPTSRRMERLPRHGARGGSGARQRRGSAPRARRQRLRGPRRRWQRGAAAHRRRMRAAGLLAGRRAWCLAPRLAACRHTSLQARCATCSRLSAVDLKTLNACGPRACRERPAARWAACRACRSAVASCSLDAPGGVLGVCFGQVRQVTLVLKD